jgi:endoglucanase
VSTKNLFLRPFLKTLFSLLLTIGFFSLVSSAGAISSQVTMENTRDWGTAFQGQTTIRNTGQDEISGWTLAFTADFEIQQIWNASIVSHSDNQYEVEGAGWNNNIAPGEAVSFGFIAAPSGSSLPAEFTVNGKNTDADNPPDPTPEPPPADNIKQIDLQATSSEDSIKLSWSLTGITPQSQEIARDTDSDPAGRQSIGHLVSETEFVDPDVSAGTTYYYWVIATEEDGTVTSSPVASSTVPATTPAEEISAVAYSKRMGVGWNAGNSLEAIGGETAWGNPLLTQQLFDAVKAAGFDTVRLPVAWSVFTDSDNFIIDPLWMARVNEVVDYALNANLYVIINIHWDGGWMQPTYGQQEYVNNRLAIMWNQIAMNFRDYDNRLLFAGTNEVMVDGDYGTPTEEYYTVQNSFNQTFVTTVRDTGGGNADRYLIVQGFNTNIDHTVNFNVMPTDSANDRLMMEVHYYDPYNFTLNTESNITQWGSIATDPDSVEDWANEDWVDSQFQKMKTNFIDKGVAVILGEYGVVSRLTVPEHERYRVYWNEYISQSAIAHGLVPIYWDNGGNGQDGSMGIFNRNDGSQLYPDIISAIVNAVQ